jgi:mRNA interferase RelE/StbE
LSATQVYYHAFDETFSKLPPPIRARIQDRIDDLGRQLGRFPHPRLKGSQRYRLRIGDYRIIYALELERNVIHLLAVGHRREIYRQA